MTASLDSEKLDQEHYTSAGTPPRWTGIPACPTIDRVREPPS